MTNQQLPPLDADQWNDLLYRALSRLLHEPPDPAAHAYASWIHSEWKRQHLVLSPEHVK